jgi:hypothetical protein
VTGNLYGIWFVDTISFSLGIYGIGQAWNFRVSTAAAAALHVCARTGAPLHWPARAVGCADQVFGGHNL